MGTTITDLETFDVRFPTSRELDGSDAVNVDHLHEHFVDPVVVERARYRAPEAPGYSAQMRRESIERHLFPGGAEWS